MRKSHGKFIENHASENFILEKNWFPYNYVRELVSNALFLTVFAYTSLQLHLSAQTEALISVAPFTNMV